MTSDSRAIWVLLAVLAALLIVNAVIGIMELYLHRRMSRHAGNKHKSTGQ